MNENLKKAIEMVKNDESLKEKISAEAARLAETMEGKDRKEIIARAVRNVLGAEILPAGTDVPETGAQELTQEAMENVSGGGNDFFKDVACFFGSHYPGPVELQRTKEGRTYSVRMCRCLNCWEKLYQKVHNDGSVESCEESDYFAY